MAGEPLLNAEYIRQQDHFGYCEYKTMNRLPFVDSDGEAIKDYYRGADAYTVGQTVRFETDNTGDYLGRAWIKWPVIECAPPLRSKL